MLTETSPAIQALASVALRHALSGALAYFRKEGRMPTEAEAPALEAAFKEELDTTLPGALDDAKEALAANMTDVAVATFAASLRLAGIRAAKRVLGQ